MDAMLLALIGDVESKLHKMGLNSNHIFADAAARDAYFTANPSELEEDIFIKTGADYQTYNGSSWDNANVVIKGEKGDQGPQGLPGNDGAAGAEGPQGEQGPQGIQGPMGPQGLQGPAGTNGVDGAQGPQGPAGADGADGQGLTIAGEKASLLALNTEFPSGDGSNAYIVSGDLYLWNGSAWYNAGAFTGPQGPQGEQGPQGIQGETGAAGTNGADGLSAYQVAVNEGFVGDETAWLTSLQGPQGIQGEQGPQGDAGADGTIGSDGVDGKSAYQVAVDAGFVGDETAWLASLQGPQGPAGADGAASFPVGGTTGQALVKMSNDDGDVDWGDVAAGEGSGGGVELETVLWSGESGVNSGTQTFPSVALAKPLDEFDRIRISFGAVDNNNTARRRYETAEFTKDLFDRMVAGGADHGFLFTWGYDVQSNYVFIKNTSDYNNLVIVCKSSYFYEIVGIKKTKIPEGARGVTELYSGPEVGEGTAAWGTDFNVPLTESYENFDAMMIDIVFSNPDNLAHKRNKSIMVSKDQFANLIDSVDANETISTAWGYGNAASSLEMLITSTATNIHFNAFAGKIKSVKGINFGYVYSGKPDSFDVETVLFEGSVGTTGAATINDIPLTESYKNFDRLQVEFYKDEGSYKRYCVGYTTPDQIDLMLTTSNNTTFPSEVIFAHGYGSVSDFSAITHDTTPTNLKVRQQNSFITKVVGVKNNEIVKEVEVEETLWEGEEGTDVSVAANISTTLSKSWREYDKIGFSVKAIYGSAAWRRVYQEIPVEDIAKVIDSDNPAGGSAFSFGWGYTDATNKNFLDGQNTSTDQRFDFVAGKSFINKIVGIKKTKRFDAVEAWNDVVFENDWANYGAPFGNAKYRKNSEGLVTIEGGVKDGTSTSNAVIFTLPEGYRPAGTMTFMVSNAIANIAKVRVNTDGTVTIYGDLAVNTLLELSGISFYAAD